MNASHMLRWSFSALALFLAGCGQQAPPKAAATAHPLSRPALSVVEPGQSGGRLTLITAGAPRTFNPLLTIDSASGEIVRLIFGGLVSVDMTTQEARPGLAESWSVEPDGRTWTFKLRPGLHWSDGQPLTADDVVFTWNEIMYNPGMNQLTYDLFRINGKNFSVSRADDAAVRVVTPEIFARFLEYFGGVPILPRHAIGREVQEGQFLSVYTLTTRPDKIVGCGPFRVKEVQPGKMVLLERNPEYWIADKAGRRLPYFDEVLLAAGGAGASALFFNGNSDVYEHPRPEEYAAFQTAASTGKFRLIELGAGSEQDFLWLNLNTKVNASGQPFVQPARSKWFRQAVSCAIDRGLVREVFAGHA